MEFKTFMASHNLTPARAAFLAQVNRRTIEKWMYGESNVSEAHKRLIELEIKERGGKY